MTQESTIQETWSEDASDLFIRLGNAFVPWRDDISAAILDLLPASKEGPFLAVELGIGTGWLSKAILERFDHAQILGLDGSERMLGEARSNLAFADDRVALREFKLQDDSWIDRLEDPPRAFVSSLAVHHLDGEGKRRLYSRLFEALEPGGALLFADIIRPAGTEAKQYYERSYEADVRELASAHGRPQDYERFMELEWNLFRFPDPVDKPSTITEHLRWLEEAGFIGVEVFWARSGHALYGGYKPR